MTPQELVAATAGPVGGLGAKYYFHPDTLAAGKDLGLDGFRFYFLGRGGMIGNVGAPVVLSAFGYFNPDVATKMWESGREICDPATAATRMLQCNAELGRAALGDIDGLDAFCQAAEATCDRTDPAALALYAGAVSQPLPEDLPARAMQNLINHRELRGSLHLAAIVATGLDPVEAHAQRRPGDMELFGWPADRRAIDGTAELLAGADELTDRMHAQLWAPASDSERAAFASGVAAIEAAFA